MYDNDVYEVEQERDELGFEREPVAIEDLKTELEVVSAATAEIVEDLRVRGVAASTPLQVPTLLLAHTNAKLVEWGEAQGMSEKQIAEVKLKRPSSRQWAEVLMGLNRVAMIPAVPSRPDRRSALMAVYDPATGLWAECVDKANGLTRILRDMLYDVSDKVIAEILSAVRDLAPLRQQTDDRDLVALKNCVYNRVTGERSAYDPDEHVFLAKAHTDLPETEPELPRIENPDGTEWGPHTWVVETMGSEEMAQTIYELIAFALCPAAFTDDKIVLLLSETGSNGKGTILSLIRGIIGGDLGIGCSALGLEMFDGKKDFVMTRLLGAKVNLSDESDADAFMASSAMLKAIASGDPVQVNRKYLDPVEVALRLAMIFSVNRLPKMKDKSGAIDRRLHIIRFVNRFMAAGTEIKKNPLIKADYLQRPEVREWFVWRALVTLGPITELSVPEAVAAELEVYRETNDGVVDFWRRHVDELEATDLTFVPFELLYDVYKAESKALRGSGAGVEHIRTFTDRLVDEAVRGGVWRDERDGRGERKRRRLTQWHSQSAPAMGAFASDYGATFYREMTSPGGATNYYEEVSGDPRVARWGRGPHNSMPDQVRSPKSVLLPQGKVTGLTRDLATDNPAPLHEHVPAWVPSPDPDAVPDLAPLTEAEMAEIAEWANRGVPAGVPPAPAGA